MSLRSAGLNDCCMNFYEVKRHETIVLIIVLIKPNIYANIGIRIFYFFNFIADF